MELDPNLSQRRPDLDWLRVFAILLLHFFHVGMMFNTWGWHLKSPTPLPILELPMELLHHVRMPLLMLISGIGTALALRRRSLGAFAWDRTKRLFLPLVVGMLVVVPPQIYLERVWRGQFHGSYLDFYPSVFQLVPYPQGGSLSWHHLWFVLYLFVYCLLALPLFAWLRTPRGRALLERVDGWLARGWHLAVFVLPLTAGYLVLRRHRETHGLFDDPRTLLYYGQLFLVGHLLGHFTRVWDHLVAQRRKLLVATLVVFAVMAPTNEYPVVPEALGTYAFVWGVLLTALAFARAHVRQARPWLTRAQSLAYPFYIFHQTVIIVVGYAFLRLPVGPWTLAGLVLVVSFAGTWGLCELTSRVNVLRPLFGMKLRTRAARPALGASLPPVYGVVRDDA